MVSEHDEPQAGGDVAARLDDLDRKLDTIAGAMATVAARQTELDAAADAQRADLGLALEVLAGIADSLERADARTEDRLASIRDAAAVPLADLQALLSARTDRTEHQLTDLVTRVEAAVAGLAAPASPDAPPLPSGVEDVVARLETALADLPRPQDGWDTEPAPPAAAPPQLDALDDRLNELYTALQSLSWQLPEVTRQLGDLRQQVEQLTALAQPDEGGEDTGSMEERLRHHTDTALAGTLRVLDERLNGLRAAIRDAAPAPAPQMGFEAGAVMGAAQAAWNRLEQRLDSEFDDLGRQLQAMGTLIEQALATAEAAANRPVVTGEQLKRTAVSMKDAVLQASRSRRERRGGPRGLGPGPR